MSAGGAPLTVLHVSHSAQRGGSNDALHTLLRRAPEGVRQAVVYLQDGPELERSRALGVDARLLDVGRAREAWKAPGAVGALRGLVRAAGADVVFAHVSKAHIYAAPAARLAGVPELWWQQENLTQKPALQRLAGSLRAAAVICSSRATGTAQTERFPGTPAHVIVPAPEAADFAAVRDHLDGAPPRIASVGRIARWKRIELAIAALPAVREAVPGVVLDVVGEAFPGVDDGYLPELEAQVARLGLQDAVRFTGFADDVPARLATYDVVVHTADREPWGRVVAEAMLAGVPPVAADSGGPLEIVREGVDGHLVDPTDTPALAAAVTGLLQDAGRRARMGAAGRDRALERFTAETTAREVWQVVRGVAGR